MTEQPQDSQTTPEPEQPKAEQSEDAVEPEPEYLYQLVTIRPESMLPIKSTSAITMEELLLRAQTIYGERRRFFLVKVPEEGKPTECSCETADELSRIIADLTHGEPGRLLVYYGEEVEVGEPQTLVPLTIRGNELTRVPLGRIDPPEEKKPEPEKPEADTPAEPPAQG